tara:strand:- start:537470 stop:538492 length:1023 start_codon:yes stop_codon:yes gene_type:complete
MNIIFDISHPAHINLFKHSIYYYQKQKKYNVYVTCLRRGKLPLIAKEELKGVNLTFVGRHRGTTLSIIFEANIRKFIELLFFVIKHKIKFGVSAGSIPLGAALKLIGRNNIQFDDDPERSKNVFLEKLTADVVFTPPILTESKKIVNFNALKEWAYLSPKYFSPNIIALDKLNLKPKEYIFAREVSTGSLNYSNQKPGEILSFSDKMPKNMKVILSLEDKNLAEFYPKDWIILKEPITDIHSLIYYSFALISSGDSMAREGAQLGVPSIYCGFRDMKANKILVEQQMLFEMKPDEVCEMIDDLMTKKIEVTDQDIFRKELETKWDDLTQLIISKVKSYEK